GSIKEIPVKLKNLEGDTKLVAKEVRSETLNMLGADFATLDKKTARELELDGGVQIKKLNAGKLRQDTDIQEGFIVTKVDGNPVRSVQDLNEVLKGKKGGVMLEGIYPDNPNRVYYYAFGM